MIKRVNIISFCCIFSSFVIAAEETAIYEYAPIGNCIESNSATQTLETNAEETFVSNESYRFLEIIQEKNNDVIEYPWRNQFIQKIKNAINEFESDLSTFSPHYNFGYEISLRNPKKNRYTNLAPLDLNRVILKELKSENKDNYINASYVPGQSLVENLHFLNFIITQAPLKDNTMEDFWQMIWEQDCRIIVMLTDFVEENQNKAEIYYPITQDELAHVYGPFVVCNNLTIKVDDIVINELLLIREGNMQKIYHIQYKKWLDHASPPSALEQLKLIDYTMHYYLKVSPRPMVVHCSAGIGRSGAFVVAYAAISQIMTTGTEPNIKEIVLNLRRCRAYNMVKYAGQYEKIYLIIEDFLNRKSRRF